MEKTRDEWLSLRALAEELDVDERVIHNQRYLGKGPKAMRLSSELRFRRSEIDRRLSEREEPAQ